jgi:hypothetical protein
MRPIELYHKRPEETDRLPKIIHFFICAVSAGQMAFLAAREQRSPKPGEALPGFGGVKGAHVNWLVMSRG